MSEKMSKTSKIILFILNTLAVFVALVETRWEDDLEKLKRRRTFVEDGMSRENKPWQYYAWMKIYNYRIKQLSK